MDLRRHLSWREDFARNVSRFFSRSKSETDRDDDDDDDDEGEVRENMTDKPEPELLDTPAAVTQQRTDRPSVSLSQDGRPEGSAGSPLDSPGPELGSPSPPDGFLKRLGNLFHFSREEPTRIQRERQSSSETDGTQETEQSCLTEGGSAGSEKLSHSLQHEDQTLSVDPSHSHTHTQSEEENQEHRRLDFVSGSERSEQKLQYDLVCPHVVTYGTYRRLRGDRKQKHRVKLHSRVSSDTRADEHENNEMMNSDSQEHSSADRSSPTQPTETSFTQLTDSESENRRTSDESGQTPSNKLPRASKTDFDHRVTLTETHSVHRNHESEVSSLNKPEHLVQTLKTVSGDIQRESRLFCADVRPSHTHLTHTHHPPPAGPEQNSQHRTDSVLLDRTELSAPAELRDTDLRTAEEDSGIDEKLLRLESQKMADSILQNALSSLQRLSESEESGGLTADPHEGFVPSDESSADKSENQFSVMSTDETLAGRQNRTDGNRSTPSSGYESITESENDIMCCVGVASDITTSCAPISSQHEENQVVHFGGEEETSCESRKTLESDTLTNDDECESSTLTLQNITHVTQKTETRRLQPDVESLVAVAITANILLEHACDKPQKTAKDLSESNKYSNTLESRSSIIITHDSQSKSLTSEQKDPEKPKTQTPADPQNHKPEHTQELSSGSEEEDFCCHYKSLSSSVVEEQTDDSGSQWSCVRALRCDVSDEISLDGAEGKTSERKIHLHLPGISNRTAAFIPQSSRLHDLDLHQADGGFDIISEEEEMDAVFVNDTGPVSPGTRRARAYPFSLSPIYEEECGREDEDSGREMLQVPPATEEEQRSVEQPASSILSLLQSVSEKLQSSVIRASDEERPECLRFVCRPLWDRDQTEEDEDKSSVPLHQHKLNAETDLSLNIDQTPNEAQDKLQDKVEKTFYPCLSSREIPAHDAELKENENVEDQSRSSRALREEVKGFGNISFRPTTMLIHESESVSSETREICHDVPDASGLLFPHGATFHALRGCWLLYDDSGYTGSCVVMEEGQTVSAGADVSVRSIRRAVKDDRVPEIHIKLRASQTQDVMSLNSAADVLESWGFLQLSDLSVRSGCWLVYDRSGFSGSFVALESGGRFTRVLQNPLVCRVKSLRPLQMGGLRVKIPLDPKVILYERSEFQGQCTELLHHTHSLELPEVSSLRVTGGIWVGFSSEHYRGRQCLLEEGSCSDCTRLFRETNFSLKSLRYLQADFLQPSVCLKSLNEEISVLDQDVSDLQVFGLTAEVKNIHVMRGAWVAYSERCFTGEQYVLETGRYSGALEWGSSRGSPLSLRPIRREVCGDTDSKFLLRVYNQTEFGGESREFRCEAPACGVPRPMSFRLIRGSWLFFDEESYSGNQYVLEEGLYPDLTSCGCVTAIKSLKPIPYSFTDSSISLFSLSGFEGLEESSDSVLENLSHIFTQSLRVNSGLWVAYEYAHFKGRQVFLTPGEFPVWEERSGWENIGSLKPLKHPKVQIQLQNRAVRSVLTTERLPENSFPAKVFLSPANRSLETQRWIFTDGLLKSTVGRGCLSVIGAKACEGARVALWEEHGRVNQRWSFNECGTISSHLNLSLVLDLKGGTGTDRDLLILNQFCVDKASQNWDVDVL